MRAFVYTEVPLVDTKPDYLRTTYNIYFPGKCLNGCHNIQSRDEGKIKAEIIALIERKINVLGRVPVEFRNLEDSIQRESYDLSFLNNTPARH